MQNDSPARSPEKAKVTQHASPRKREVKSAKGSAWSPAEVTIQKKKGECENYFASVQLHRCNILIKEFQNTTNKSYNS